MSKLSLYENINESYFNNGSKVYVLKDGTSVTHTPKLVTRKEAEQMLENFVNNIGMLKISYHFSKGLIFTNTETNQEVDLKSIERTLDRFDRLRNYEIEERFLKYFNETFLISELCPFNNNLSY